MQPDISRLCIDDGLDGAAFVAAPPTSSTPDKPKQPWQYSGSIRAKDITKEFTDACAGMSTLTSFSLPHERNPSSSQNAIEFVFFLVFLDPLHLSRDTLVRYKIQNKTSRGGKPDLEAHSLLAYLPVHPFQIPSPTMNPILTRTRAPPRPARQG